MLREHEVDLSDPATHNTLDPHQPFTVEVEINVAASLALILVTTLHWHRNAVRSLATHASVLMHDTTHGLIFGGAQVWALGTVDVQHHVLQEHSVQVSAPSQQYVCSHRHTLT